MVAKHPGTHAVGYRLFFSLVSLLLSAVITALALRTAKGQAIDSLAMEAVRVRLQSLFVVSRWLSNTPTEVVLAVFAVGVLGLTFLQKRLAVGVRALVFFALANVSAQILKAFFERPNLGIGYALANSLPSGHVTALASALIVLLVVTSGGAQGVIAVAGVFLTSLVGVSVVALGWHRPGDVLVALLLVIVWAMVVLPNALGPKRTAPAYFLAVGVTGFILAALTTAMVAVDFPDVSTGAPADLLISLGAASSPGGLLAIASIVAIAGISTTLFGAVLGLLSAGSARDRTIVPGQTTRV